MALVTHKHSQEYSFIYMLSTNYEYTSKLPKHTIFRRVFIFLLYHSAESPSSFCIIFFFNKLRQTKFYFCFEQTFYIDLQPLHYTTYSLLTYYMRISVYLKIYF